MSKLGRYPILVVLAAQIAWAGPNGALSDAQAAPGQQGQDSAGTRSSEVRIANEIGNPIAVGETETDQQRWRRIIEALCAIIPCKVTDPPKNTTPSATLALHVMLDRYELEGFAPNLTPELILEGIANVSQLIALLAGPEWNTLVQNAQERDELAARLNAMMEHLAMLRAQHNAPPAAL